MTLQIAEEEIDKALEEEVMEELKCIGKEDDFKNGALRIYVFLLVAVMIWDGRNDPVGEGMIV